MLVSEEKRLKVTAEKILVLLVRKAPNVLKLLPCVYQHLIFSSKPLVLLANARKFEQFSKQTFCNSCINGPFV